MTVKNEAVRLFLAVTALILTAMLTNPLAEETTPAALAANGKKVITSKQSTKQIRRINKYVVVTSRQTR